MSQPERKPTAATPFCSTDRESIVVWLKENFSIEQPTKSQVQNLRRLLSGERKSYKGWKIINGTLIKELPADKPQKAHESKPRSDKHKPRKSHKPYTVRTDTTGSKLRITVDMESDKIELYEINDPADGAIDKKNIELRFDYLSTIESETGLIIHDGGNHINRIMLPEENGVYGRGTLHWKSHAEYNGQIFIQENIAVIPKYGSESDDWFTTKIPKEFDISLLLEMSIRIPKRYDIEEIDGVSYE